MDEAAALESLDRYEGPVMATHANCAALLKGAETNRHLRDHVIEGLIERDGSDRSSSVQCLSQGWLGA